MRYRINTDKSAAVATDYFYQPIETAPRGVKIIGLSATNVARIDRIGKDSGDLIAWAPLPKMPNWLRELQ
jgi:hypothetical protein